MIPIRELGGSANIAVRAKRHIVTFRFYCDLSYDGSDKDAPRGQRYIPRTYVVGGLFSSQSIWNVVEDGWQEINKFFKVPRFHAAHLNGKKHEYLGWDDDEKVCYSRKLLKLINDQGKKMRPVACGILADEYRAIINKKGQENLGSPYLACFNSCIALIAREMHQNFPPEDKFEAFIDIDDGYLEAVDSFNQMKADPKFLFRNKLATCTPGVMEEIIPLQSADMIAYEVYKRLHGVKDTESKMRPVLELLYKNNAVSERYFGAKTLRTRKADIESAVCRRGGLVICPTT